MPLAMDIGGKRKAADLKAFVNDLTPAQIAWMTQLWAFAAETNDVTVFIEIYPHLANRWNDMTPDERRAAASEGEARWFTEEAWAEFVADQKEQQETKKTLEQEGMLLDHNGRPIG